MVVMATEAIVVADKNSFKKFAKVSLSTRKTSTPYLIRLRWHPLLVELIAIMNSALPIPKEYGFNTSSIGMT